MKKETQTKCTEKVKGQKCQGVIFRQHNISRMENSLGHRIYTCEKCNQSWKFNIGGVQL